MEDSLSFLWALPFIGMLLSIAILPMLAPKLWHRHYGKVGIFWILCFLFPWMCSFGIEKAVHDTLHALIFEYIPFTSLIAALFTITGNIRLKTQWLGTPKGNTAILATGTVLASWIGTTGASMLLIHPLIRANSWREKNVHTKIFFIFLVANIGGALSPLGDPPLFIGFLNGVDFFWTTRYLFFPLLTMALPLLFIFYFIDSYYHKKEIINAPMIDESINKFSIEGKHNFIYLGALLGIIFLSGSLDIKTEVNLAGLDVPIIGIIRDFSMWILCYLSLITTSKQQRKENGFSWDPFVEVAKLFLSIFLTAIPVIMILSAGKKGALSVLIDMVSDDQGTPIASLYFWVTGALSAFLDNAPTYFVYFHTAGGDADQLMKEGFKTLMAISSGAVFMGALTYIGNAPNFMVKAIAEQQGIRMPGFLGYMAWSLVLLVPLFILLTFIYFTGS